MKMRALRIICFGAWVALAVGSAVQAQNHVPAMPPPPPLGPGMPGAPGGMNPAVQNPHEGAGHPGQQRSAAPAANAPVARPGLQFGPVGRWWDDKSVARTVGLSSDQKLRMDTIVAASRPAIVDSYQTYLKEQAKLSALSRDPQATQEATFAAIDSVNQARTALQKATAQMYLQIRQQMTPDQVEKLQKLE